MPARKPSPAPQVEESVDDFDALLAAEDKPTVAAVQGTINDIPVGEPDVVATGTVNGVTVSENVAPETSIEDLVAAVDDGPRSGPVPELTPAQARLAAARAALAAQQQAAQHPLHVDEPDEYEGLTEQEIAELKAVEDQVAQNNARAIETAPAAFDNSRKGGTGEKILFHVVRDGFTAFGEVWLRGQEIEVEVGTATHKRTFNALGQTWLDIIDDPRAQMLKWKRHYISPGEFIPNPGEKFEDEVARADRRRGRSVPLVTTID